MTTGKARHYYTNDETHAALIRIGVSAGADPERAASRGVRVAARNYEGLVAQLAEAKEFMEVELTGTAWADCRHMEHSIGKILAQLEAGKGGG